MADWGDLPGGVLALFAKRLQLIEDLIAFRSTCSSWRKATSLSDFDKSCPRLPLLLLHKSDEKRWGYVYASPSEVDEVDENTQIHSSDYEDTSSDEYYSDIDDDYSYDEDSSDFEEDEEYDSDDEDYSDDESDCENDKGGKNDDVHESEEIKENTEIVADREKSVIKEDTSDDEDYSESDETVADEVNCKNDKGGENDDVHESDDEDYSDEEYTSDYEDYSDDEDEDVQRVNSETDDNSESDEEKSEIEDIKENTEIVADEVNYENGKVDKSNRIKVNSETDDNSESSEEKSVESDYENDKIQEGNSHTSDTDDSDEIKDNEDIVADKVNYKNGKGGESNRGEENFETDDNSKSGEENSVDSDYENDNMQEGSSDTDDYCESDESYDSREQRMFLSLSKEKGCMILLPEAIGMECRGSKGWLIMVERSTGTMCLFHPLTRARIPLPKAPSEFMFPMRSAVLSASPSETSDYVVMVAYPHISGICVVFCKPGIGDQTWTIVETPAPCVEDLKYYNGKFYALTWRSEVWMCDISGPNPINKAIKIIELPWKWSRPRAQLVECGGRLLIVAPFFRYHCDTEIYHDLKMVELDVIKGRYSTITSLGSSTVFLGCNEAFSVDANQFPPGIIEPNRIYFSDRSYRIASRGRSNVPRPDLGVTARGLWINF